MKKKKKREKHKIIILEKMDPMAMMTIYLMRLSKGLFINYLLAIKPLFAN